MCVNYTDLNSRVIVKRYPIRDVNEVIQRLYGSIIFSGVDLKSGFHNMRVADDSLELMGVVTQDGLFQYRRMTFGLSEAPMFFQACMEEIIARKPGLSTEPYLDDLTSHGRDWRQVWKDTLATFELLAEEGIMINIKKCKLLTTRVDLLGFTLYDNLHQLGPKSLANWTGV